MTPQQPQDAHSAVVEPEVLTFSVPLPPRGLRRNSQTQRHGYRMILRREYSEAVFGAMLAAGITAPRWPRVRLTLTWCACVLPDRDNVIGNCKALIDHLRCQQAGDSRDKDRYWLGLFEDDGPECLISVEPRVQKIAHRSDECVQIRVERVVS